MNSSPEGGAAGNPERSWWRLPWLWPIAAGALAGIVLRLVYSGDSGGRYNAMMSAFVLLVPVVVGAVTVYVAELSARRTWGYYFFTAATANALFVVGTFVILIEGLICAVIALPLFAVVGGLAGIATGAVCRWTRWPRRTVYGLAVLPILFGALEQYVSLPDETQSVERTLMIAAPAEQVWTQLLTARQIEPSEIDSAWMYRIGVPPPLSATTETQGGELVRHITMGRNIHFDQVSADWEAGRRVRWTYRFEADSIPPHVLDDHVRIGGPYFDLIDTEYSLAEAPGGTQLHVRMRYRVSTHFNWYAAAVARFFVGNFEEAALAFYARRAEAAAGQRER